MNATKKLIDVLSDKHQLYTNYSVGKFIYLASNYDPRVAFDKYIQNSTTHPLIVIGSVGSGKTHLVVDGLRRLKIECPSLSVERFNNDIRRAGIKYDEIDIHEVQKAYPVLFLDSADVTLKRREYREHQETIDLFASLTRIGCKVILTSTELYGYPTEKFVQTSIDQISDKEAFKLAKHFFAKDFGYLPQSIEDLEICRKARSAIIRVVERNIKRYFLIKQLR
ncbi:hypothetical protein DOM22_05340 [Bdellovibrio sp. ZAP7]|uniref:ATP-binding protein n=1 Tax=Bdellovibrio sp. ZAP7 TaxID=2231053 RepID=UPI001158C427|nr:ATP-binding protein [Bdellovibrio sp. ZAP7]QDK44625.1 hypothetical protein DOM22_05340 [Bdellovibrio sp. ZAP7]